MNNFDKIKSFFKTFRIIVGIVVIACGFYFTNVGEVYNIWFALGLIPLIAGFSNFCLLDIFSKKCTTKNKED